MDFPSFDELTTTNWYARQRLETSQNHLLLALWGFFEKAAIGLTRLYKGKDFYIEFWTYCQSLSNMSSFSKQQS